MAGKLLWVDICECRDAMIDPLDREFESGDMSQDFGGMLKCGNCGHLCRVVEIDFGEDPAHTLDEAVEGLHDAYYPFDMSILPRLRAAVAAIRGES